jgi:hypothetical protein
MKPSNIQISSLKSSRKSSDVRKSGDLGSGPVTKSAKIKNMQDISSAFQKVVVKAIISHYE